MISYFSHTRFQVIFSHAEGLTQPELMLIMLWLVELILYVVLAFLNFIIKASTGHLVLDFVEFFQ